MPQPLDLAVAGNGTVAALITPQARVVWMCWPVLDGDPVFCALMDGAAPDGGFLDVTAEEPHTTTQRYRRNTAIVETDFATGSGARFRVVDTVPRLRRFGRMFHPAMLVRRIEPIEGRPRIRIRARPRFGWGRESPQPRRGSNHLRWVAESDSLRITTDVPVPYIAAEAPFALDRPVTLIVGPDETLAEPPMTVGRTFEEETEAYWHEFSRFLAVPFEWQEAVIRAAITLKLCANDDAGGIVAALTTSIPEAPGSRRNWDYRFCWLRDAWFTVQALNRLGATQTMENYLRYIGDTALGDGGTVVHPLYPLIPGTPLEETEAGCLKGFLNDGPVRVGNAAARQVQNDVYGSIVLAAAQMFYDERLPRPGDIGLFRQLERLGELAEAAAMKPDAGIWEYRGRARVHTFPAAMCWAAMDRIARIARRLGLDDAAKDWAGRAAPVRDQILRRAWNPALGAFTESLDGDTLDAATLTLSDLGLIAPTDPRFVSTVATVERELMRDGLVHRYAAPDDFGTPETAFLVCNFWLVDALVAVGRVDDARALFQRILALRNHVGLLSEDADPATGQLWGNFPQTYSQVGLILSAMRLSRSWEEGFWRAW
jgi:GH15 family glucan-1,4-alpha-glucosidase